jgi:hypothetical protein
MFAMSILIQSNTTTSQEKIVSCPSVASEFPELEKAVRESEDLRFLREYLDEHGISYCFTGRNIVFSNFFGQDIIPQRVITLKMDYDGSSPTGKSILLSRDNTIDLAKSIWLLGVKNVDDLRYVLQAVAKIDSFTNKINPPYKPTHNNQPNDSDLPSVELLNVTQVELISEKDNLIKVKFIMSDVEGFYIQEQSVIFDGKLPITKELELRWEGKGHRIPPPLPL